MKIYLSAITAIVLSTSALPSLADPSMPLVSLDEVKAALNRGADVAVTIDLTKCTPAGTTTTPGTVQGGLKIDAYRITPDGSLSFSDSHQTVDSTGKPIWQFIRYQVKPDQTVAFSSFFFSLPSYTSILPEVDYACSVNQGLTFFADRR